MNKELLLEGNKIISELGEEPTLLNKWMAHYIAELMEKSELPDKEEAARAKELCSQLIINLWETKSKRDIVKIQQHLRTWNNKEKYCHEDKYSIIKKILKNPENFRENSEIEIPLLISYLRDIESDLILIWLISSSQSKTDPETIQHAAEKFHLSDEELHTKRENLSKIFTAFNKINLIDFEKISKKVSISLKKVYSLRYKILWQEPDEVAGSK